MTSYIQAADGESRRPDLCYPASHYSKQTYCPTRKDSPFFGQDNRIFRNVSASEPQRFLEGPLRGDGPGEGWLVAPSSRLGRDGSGGEGIESRLQKSKGFCVGARLRLRLRLRLRVRVRLRLRGQRGIVGRFATAQMPLTPCVVDLYSGEMLRWCRLAAGCCTEFQSDIERRPGTIAHHQCGPGRER